MRGRYAYAHVTLPESTVGRANWEQISDMQRKGRASAHAFPLAGFAANLLSSVSAAAGEQGAAANQCGVRCGWARKMRTSRIGSVAGGVGTSASGK